MRAARLVWSLVGFAALVAACSIPDKHPGEIDGAAIDAPVIDGTVIDAPIIDATIIDTAIIDTAVIDAPTDAPTDATGTCSPGLTYCGAVTGCVDLQTSSANCGACAYEVRGARTCVAGKPSPGWVTMAAVPWTVERARIQAWTGHRFLVITDTQERAYNPVTDTWTADGAVTVPFTIPAGGEFSWAKVPGANRVAIWEGTHTVDGNELFLLDDSGAATSWGTWMAGGPNTELGTRRGATVIATSADVYVGFGWSHESVVRYNLAGATYTKSGEHPLDCGPSQARWMNPIAVVNGSIVTHGGVHWNGGHCMGPDITKAALPSMATWSTALATFAGVRTGHIFVEFNNQLLYGGGRASGGGGGSCAAQGLDLIDVNTGVRTNITDFTQPPLVPSDTFVVRTGRSVMVWGGRNPACNNSNIATYNTGSIGVISGSDVTWSVLPTTNAPSARAFVPNDHQGWGSSQPMWSGYEAIVFGGASATAALIDGATYQPPAGCVCPDAATESCAGVTSVPATCTP